MITYQGPLHPLGECSGQFSKQPLNLIDIYCSGNLAVPVYKHKSTGYLPDSVELYFLLLFPDSAE